jgi:hypothetical protein
VITDTLLVRFEEQRLLAAFTRRLRVGRPLVVHIFGQEGLTRLLLRWVQAHAVPVVVRVRGRHSRLRVGSRVPRI